MIILGDAFEAEIRIGRHAQAFADHFHPVDLVFLGIKSHPISVAPRVKQAGVIAGNGDLLGFGRFIIRYGCFANHWSIGKENSDRIGATLGARQSVFNTVKPGLARAHRRCAGKAGTGFGVARQRNGHLLLLQRFAFQLHAAIRATGQVAAVQSKLARLAGFTSRRHDEINVRPLGDGQAKHMLGPAAIHKVMQAHVVFAISHRHEIHRLPGTAALQLQAGGVLDDHHRFQLGIEIPRQAIDNDPLPFLEGNFIIGVIPRGRLAIDDCAQGDFGRVL